MGFGKAEPQTTTTSTTHQMSPDQQRLLGLAMPGIEKWMATTPQRYKGQTIAGFDPAQKQAQDMLLKASGAQQGIADNAASASNFWTGGNVWDPTNNPALQGAVDASGRAITQQFNENIMPGIRGGAISGGNFGSSRQGIAEGLAAGRTSQAVGDSANKLINENYKTNVDAQMKALGLAPQTQALQNAPGLTTAAVGDQRRAMAQALLDAEKEGFNFDQNAGYLQSRDLLSLLSGIPGGTNTSTATGPKPGGNAFTGALGGAASGASMGSMFGPWGTGIGALGGGLYGLLNR
jgi:hypothetical protein